jgi:hypothetical protein
VLADYLSRDLVLATQAADERDGTGYTSLPRAEACRRLLTICISQSSKMHGQEILTLLTRLRSEDGRRCANTCTRTPTAGMQMGR